MSNLFKFLVQKLYKLYNQKRSILLMVEPIFNLTDDFGNLTDVQKRMIRIAFQDGKKIGEQIAADVESGIL